MKIGELNDHCGNCKLIDYCTEPYETPHLCVYEELENIDEETYKQIAENIAKEEIEDKLRQYEQLSIFDYLPPCTNFPQLIADELVKHCEKWGYDYVERLKQQGGRQFYNIFCRITKTYFVHKGPEEYYEVEFSKNGKAVVKRCGKDFFDKGADVIIDIQSVADILIQKFESKQEGSRWKGVSEA